MYDAIVCAPSPRHIHALPPTEAAERRDHHVNELYGREHGRLELRPPDFRGMIMKRAYDSHSRAFISGEEQYTLAWFSGSIHSASFVVVGTLVIRIFC